MEALDPEMIPLLSNDGLDAQWFDKHRLPTLTFGAG
jgi:hypothetical protein